MANYGKYYIAVRLLLLKQYLEANAGRTRIMKRQELEQFLTESGMTVEMKYCCRNMKLLRNEVSFGHEVKFALCAAAHFIRKAYFICGSIFHLPQGKFH